MIRVDCRVLSGPNLNVAVDGVVDRLTKAGWAPSTFGTGAPTWYPSPVEAHFEWKREDTAVNRGLALAAVRGATLAGVPGMWWDFVSTGTSEVVAKSAEDAKDAVVAAGEIAKDTAFGFGIGSGIAVVILAAVGGYLYLRAGRA